MESDYSHLENVSSEIPEWPGASDSEIGLDAVLFVLPNADPKNSTDQLIISRANWISNAWLATSGVSILGLTIEQVPILVQLGLSTELLRTVNSSEKNLNQEVSVSSGNSSRTMRVQVTNEHSGGWIITIADVTARKRTKANLDESQKLLSRIASALPEFVFLVDPGETQVSFASKDLLNYLGYHSEREQKQVSDWRTLVHPDDIVRCDDHRWQTIASSDGEVVDSRCRLRTHSGDWRWFEVRSIIFQRDDTGKPIQILRSIYDVTSQAVAEIEIRDKVLQLARQKEELATRHEQLEYLNKQLAALATTDGLTGLYNYRAFNDKLDDEIRRAKRYQTPLSLVFSDIDDFKAFNDHYGHPSGDERLRYFSRTLTEGSRSTDFVARYGGEEFAVVLPNTAVEGAVSFAKSVLRKLHEDSSSRAITASFGCVELDLANEDKSQFIERADQCLYRAKRQGKDRVVSEEKQDELMPVFI